MLRLQNMGLRSHPEICATLMGLNGSLHRALKLVTECQKRNRMHRFLTAGDMAKQLRQVHDNIQRKIQLGILAISASTLEVTVEFTRTTIIRRDAALPSQQPGAANMEKIHSRYSSIGDASGRSEENGDGMLAVATATTGIETPFDHSPSENISGGSDYTTIVTEEAVVFKILVHLDSGVEKIKRHVYMMEGVKGVELDQKADEMMVTGTVDVPGLVAYLQEKLLPVEPVVYPSMMATAVARGAGAVLGDEDDGAAVVGNVDPVDEPVVELLQISGGVDDTMVRSGMDRPLHKRNNNRRARSSGFFRARLARWMWPRARGSASPPPSPLCVEDDTDAPELVAATCPTPCSAHLLNTATWPADYPAAHLLPPSLQAQAMEEEDDLYIATTDPLQRQPALRRRRRTFNMSRVHRSVRLPSARHRSSRKKMMPHGHMQPSSSERWGACVLQLLVPCALCTLLLVLASVWVLR